MINTQPLAIPREIDRTGSLTLAADKLCLTQSAVSHAIRRFEERHGMKLWARDGRKLRLTPAGDYLLSVANRVLPQLEYSAKVLDDFADVPPNRSYFFSTVHPHKQPMPHGTGGGAEWAERGTKMGSGFGFKTNSTRFDETYKPAENTRLTTNFANLARGAHR